MHRLDETTPGTTCIEATGPWPFVTRHVHRQADGSVTVWSSRHHRKGLVAPELADVVALTQAIRLSLWIPANLNWWIGTIFAIGAALFALASLLSLAPALATQWSITSATINAMYFAGSIPFTTAAYLQLFQAARAAPLCEAHEATARPRSLFAWRPRDVGWLSCALQFAGTILFNFNTFDAMIPSLTWFEQDFVVWVPNSVGSLLFLASGYLAFIETCHAHWAWRPRNTSWWVVFVNLLGCVGFLVSAAFSLVLPGPASVEATTLAVAFTLQGAICFLVGSLLMLPEAAATSAAASGG